MQLSYDENFIILTSTVFDWSTRVTDGRTDGLAIAFSPAYAIMLSRAKNRNVTVLFQTSAYSLAYLFACWKICYWG